MEAALVIPILFLVILTAIDGGVEMYLECQEMLAALESEEKQDTVKLFYLCNEIGEIVGDGDSIY